MSKLENQPCIKIAHVNPKSFEREVSIQAETTEDGIEGEVKVETETLWFIGLDFDKPDGKKEVNLTEDIQAFIDTGFKTKLSFDPMTFLLFSVINAGLTLEGREQMKIKVEHVKRGKLTDYLPPEVIGKPPRSSKVSYPTVLIILLTLIIASRLGLSMKVE